MREDDAPLIEPEDGDIMAGDRRIARADTALPDWYISDGAYRSIPIAWFAGALILQVIVQPAIFILLLGFSGLYTIAAGLLATAMIAHFTWRRGMAEASRTWQVATGLMLLFFLSLTVITAISRI